MHILLAEDEPRLAAFVRKGLVEEGHVVDVAEDGHTALSLGQAGGHDVIIMDVMMPGLNGLQVTAKLRALGIHTPILILTARDSRADVVQGLDVGADDYLAKTFDFSELLARLRALGRRTQPVQTQLMRFGDLDIDRMQHEVRRGGALLPLTPTEFRLLDALLRTPGQVVTRTELLDRVWGMDFDPGTSLIDVHLTNLRKKLEDGDHPRLIVSVRGVGFRMQLPGEA